MEFDKKRTKILDVYLIVDISISNKLNVPIIEKSLKTMIENIKKGIKSFRSQLYGKDVRITFIPFNGDFNSVFKSVPVEEVDTSKIQLVASGCTDIGSPVIYAIEDGLERYKGYRAENLEPIHPLFILFTDGKPEGYTVARNGNESIPAMQAFEKACKKVKDEEKARKITFVGFSYARKESEGAKQNYENLLNMTIYPNHIIDRSNNDNDDASLFEIFADFVPTLIEGTISQTEGGTLGVLGDNVVE